MNKERGISNNFVHGDNLCHLLRALYYIRYFTVLYHFAHCVYHFAWKGIMSKEHFDAVEDKALKLFEFGQKVA